MTSPTKALANTQNHLGQAKSKHGTTGFEQSKQQCSSSKRDSVTFLSTVSTMTEWSAPSNDITFARLQMSNIHSNNLFIDGVSDKVGSVRTKSPVNINKSLPPVPQLEPSIPRVPHSASPKTPSFAFSQDTTNRPSTASSICSGRSRSSSKTDFRITTRGLINPDMAGRNIKLSPIEPDMYLNPAKYDPGSPARSLKT
jgi:hypothetical protein